MICHRLRTVFVHIPKTGGQSIEQLFLDAMGLTWQTRGPLLLTTNKDPDAGPPFLAHLFAREYVEKGYLAPLDFSDYLKFTVVRNPWDRAVSEYKYRYAREMSFREYIFETSSPASGSNEERHQAPQWAFVHDAAGGMLVDYVLRFENLAAEFASLARKIFGEERTLPQVNVSTDTRPYCEFYDAQTREAIARRYAIDIEWLGYSF